MEEEVPGGGEEKRGGKQGDGREVKEKVERNQRGGRDEEWKFGVMSE